MTCEHRTKCCCKIGRFGGRPSLGVCMTVCEIGTARQWPPVAVAESPRPDGLQPCEGCGEGFDPPARIEPNERAP